MADWQRRTLDWNDERYPVGTMARSHTGSTWTKLGIGVWKASKGDYFPRPGADALEIKLPVPRDEGDVNG